MPNVHILHGDEELLRTEATNRLRGEVIVEGMGQLNVSMLDGKHLQARELQDICNVMPFLAPTRLVIVSNFLAQFEKTGNKEPSTNKKAEGSALAAYLAQVPPTTMLVFVEDKSLSKRNPVLQTATKLKNCKIQEFKHLDARNGKITAWVKKRAQEKGVRIEGSAANLLAANVGNNLRNIDLELEKLAAYAGYTDTISRADVQDLVPAVFEEKVFSLVDSLGQRNGRRAIRMIEEFLENRVNELYLLTMIARQFRLILGAKDLENRGASPAEIGRQLHASSRDNFVARKLLQQARMFGSEELVRIQELILATDQTIKTGKMVPQLALQTLAITICAHRRSNAQQARSSVRTN